MCEVAAALYLIQNENDEASMLRLRGDDPAAISLLAAIRTGDLPSLQGILAEQPAMASAIIGDGAKSRMSRRTGQGIFQWTRRSSRSLRSSMRVPTPM